MHYYKHNIGGYRSLTAHLTLLEHGCLRQLMDMYYLSEQPITLETEVVFRRLCAKTDEDKFAIQTVLDEFFLRTEKGYVWDDIAQAIRDYQGKADAARDNGKLGGRPRKTGSVILNNQSGSENKPKRKLTNNHKPLTKNHSILTHLVSLGVTEQTANDFIEHRKNLKAPLTVTAINGFVREAQKASISLEKAIGESVLRGWRGFKAEWWFRDNPQQQQMAVI